MRDRSNYWDNIKAILITLVVVTHFMNRMGSLSGAIYEGVYLFHMPFFIFVSGLFHDNKRIGERVISLAMVGVVYNAFLILIDNIIYQQEQDFYLFRATKIPWFVFTIAICAIVTYLIRDFKPFVILPVALFVAIIACYDGTLMQYMSISKAVGWFPFYYLGTIVDREKLEHMVKIPVAKWGGTEYCWFSCF